MSINDYKEKEYECMALVKNHTELFTYDKQNDIYYSKMFNVSIGNKRKLQEEIERHCKSDSDKNKLGKLVEDYSSKDILCAIYNSKGGCGVYPIAMVFESKDIENQIEQLHQHQMNDKYINGTVEAQYDNYLSAEEEADMADSKQLSKYLSKIDDKTVFDVTDYGREQHYRENGYYNEIQNDDPDICD